MRYLNFLIILLPLTFFSCAKKINSKSALPGQPANNSQLPNVSVSKKQDEKTTKNKPETLPVKPAIPSDESGSDYETLEESCITKEQFIKIKSAFDELLTKESIPLENLIDGKSQEDINDLKKILADYNGIQKKINDKCPLIDTANLKYIRKTLSNDQQIIGIEVVDSKHRFCIPCYDRKTNTYQAGVK